MAVPAVTTIYEGPTILIKRIIMDATVEAAAEVSVIDASAVLDSYGIGGIRSSILEASWTLDASFTGKISVHDEGNDIVLLVMNGEGFFNGTGFGGLPSTDEVAQATDQDINFDLATTDEVAGGGNIVLVFRKKSD